MRILQLHNTYVRPGGEDTVVEQEAALLRSHGHDVQQITVSNRDVAPGGGSASLRIAAGTVWNRRFTRRIEAALGHGRPDLVHVHNTFVRMSPAVFWTCSRLRVPVVYTLHNYRLACANALLLRDGRSCELCVGRIPWPALRHRCYRDSRGATAVLFALQVTHRLIGTYRRKVDGFITLTGFARDLAVRAGLSRDRVHVKPNFVDVPATDPGEADPRPRRICCIGRIDHEKGVDLLLEAWSRCRPEGWTLVIAGDGSARADLARRFSDCPAVEWRGWLDRREVFTELRRCRFVVMPSRAYEGSPMVLLEALARGTPVIAPRHGGFPEFVEDGREGILYDPSDGRGLDRAFQRAKALGEEPWRQWSRQARRTHRRCYSPQAAYDRLMEIYEKVRSQERSRNQ